MSVKRGDKANSPHIRLNKSLRFPFVLKIKEKNLMQKTTNRTPDRTKKQLGGRVLQNSPNKKRTETRGRKPNPSILIPIEEKIDVFFYWTKKGQPAISKAFVDLLKEYLEDGNIPKELEQYRTIWKYILGFLWDSALRVGESVNAKTEDLTGNKLRILTSKQKETYNGKKLKKKVLWRTVSLTDETLMYYKTLTIGGIIKENYLFRLSDTEKQSNKRINEHLARLCKLLELNALIKQHTKGKHANITSKMFRNGRNIWFQKTGTLALEQRADYLGHEARVQPWYDVDESYDLCDLILDTDKGISNPNLGTMKFNEFMDQFTTQFQNVMVIGDKR